MYPSEHFRDVLGIMTIDELSAALDITKETLARWRVSGQGPYYTKLGKSVFYRRADVRAWINQSTLPPAPLPHNTNALKPVVGEQADIEEYIESMHSGETPPDLTNQGCV
jgi:predicted DNA-binding transcriptional regulator AlpA